MENISKFYTLVPYKCPLCLTMKQSPSSFMKHLSRFHYYEVKNAYEKCFKLKTKHTYRNISKDEKNVVADNSITHSKSSTVKAYENLKPSTSKDDLDISKSQLCNLESNTKEIITKNTDYGSFKEWKPFLCPHCGSRSNDRINMRKHIKTFHPDFDANIQTILSEEEAKSSFLKYRKNRYIINNKLKELRPVPTFKCKSCDYVALHKYNLNKHIKDIHIRSNRKMKQNKKYTKWKPFLCPHCGLKSSDRYNMRRHIKNHHPDFDANVQTVLSEDIFYNNKRFGSMFMFNYQSPHSSIDLKTEKI